MLRRHADEVVETSRRFAQGVLPRADETCTPRLWKLFAAGEGPFSGERNAVLTPLVRLAAPGIRDLLLADLAKDEFRPALRQLRTLLQHTHDQGSDGTSLPFQVGFVRGEP